MTTPILNLDDIQGNIFGGFNKDWQANLFLKFKTSADGCAWVKEIADRVADSSSSDVIEFNNEFKRLKKEGVAKPEKIIQAIWVNIAFSWQGLKLLGVSTADLNVFPQAFKDG